MIVTWLGPLRMLLIPHMVVARARNHRALALNEEDTRRATVLKAFDHRGGLSLGVPRRQGLLGHRPEVGCGLLAARVYVFDGWLAYNPIILLKLDCKEKILIVNNVTGFSWSVVAYPTNDNVRV